MMNMIRDTEKSQLLNLLRGKTLFISGATGLIGSTIVRKVLISSEERKLDIRIIALVRDEERAKNQFKDIPTENLKFVTGDVSQKIILDEPVHYIIHAASQTASKAFVEQPVETIRTAFDGTLNMLEFARTKQAKGFIYLSSMEVYGSPASDSKICEDYGSNINTMSVRSSYPESKRMCESLCTAYWKEYDVPTKVIRLTQTFGPGIRYNDSRVFAEFARCALEKRDIVLHTKGETKRSYLYTEDAAEAILMVLLFGKPGESYNAANEKTYCSIFEMAKLVAKECAGNEIKVVIQEEDENKYGYAPVLRMNLDVHKLMGLGWKPEVDLVMMFKQLIKHMVENNE